jgi:hypothetical protein
MASPDDLPEFADWLAALRNLNLSADNIEDIIPRNARLFWRREMKGARTLDGDSKTWHRC